MIKLSVTCYYPTNTRLALLHLLFPLFLAAINHVMDKPFMLRKKLAKIVYIQGKARLKLLYIYT